VPDIVQGALIGIAGAIVGAIIAAISSYMVTKVQISTRLYELRTDRLIKRREQVLIPLGAIMSQSLGLAEDALKQMVIMTEAHKRGTDAKEIQEAKKRWEEASVKSREADTEFENLRRLVSDSRLYQMIEEVKDAEEKESPKIIEIMMRALNPQYYQNIEALSALTRELKEARKRIFDKLLVMNKRIDELLSGEPSS
jgi:esterase/lipase